MSLIYHLTIWANAHSTLTLDLLVSTFASFSEKNTSANTDSYRQLFVKVIEDFFHA